MAVYAIGDVQGCYDEFAALLTAIRFDPDRDRLWLTGDLVNRGPDSLHVLETVKALGKAAVVVLGNHDLHLLACANLDAVKPRRNDTLDAVLSAPNRDELLHWLRHRPLIHVDSELGYLLVHAGLAPQWSVALAIELAAEVSQALRAPTFADFLGAMYGNAPARWHPNLDGMDRLRFITNCITRMRLCDARGTLDLTEKGAPGSNDGDLEPWYAVPGRASAGTQIVFGHWSTLRLTPAQCRAHGVFPLDTGAVWGGELTAMRLSDRARFSVKARVPRRP